jgi:chromosome segregation ATPase
MQEKEVMTQPRTDTATLIKSCQLIWLHLQSDDEVASAALREIADRLAEQEETIKVLRAELVELSAKAMSGEDTIRHLRVEICNASAILMTHLETIKKIEAEVDLLNSRPKR